MKTVQNWRPDEDLETKINALLKFDPLNEISSDSEFIQQLNQKLLLLEQPQPDQLFCRIWFNGICNGLAAAALGVIIFISLQVLPSLLMEASLTGTELIHSKIVGATLNQNILWKKFIMDLQQLK